MLAFFKRILNIKVTASACGHQTKIKDQITAFGETRGYILLLENGQAEYCHDCLRKMAIQCARCGKPIFIGDPITLYTTRGWELKPPIFTIPSWAKVYSHEPLRLVGCLRFECESFGNRNGFWEVPGQVRRVQSPAELAIQSGGMVINNDLSDPLSENQVLFTDQ